MSVPGFVIALAMVLCSGAVCFRGFLVMVGGRVVLVFWNCHSPYNLDLFVPNRGV
jgi:hypothetical protein